MSLWKRTMDYLGLGPDDAYDDYDDYDDPGRAPREPDPRGGRGYEPEPDDTVRTVSARPSFPSRDFDASAARRSSGPPNGRGDDTDIHIDDEGVSRHHARVVKMGAGHVLVDLNSRNGLIVNGFGVTEHELEDGDRVQLGATTILRFAYHDQLEQDFQERVLSSVSIDAVTGVVNRRFFLEQLRSGKDKVLGFFVGQVMKQTQGKANPKQVNEIIRSKL